MRSKKYRKSIKHNIRKLSKKSLYKTNIQENYTEA